MNPQTQKIEELIKAKFSNQNQIFESFSLNLISDYANFLGLKNLEGGFFSKTDSENILERHILECIYHIAIIIQEIPISREIRVLDFGTGPGLPGFLFSCLKNFPSITLLDSQKKRIWFLEEFYKSNKSYPRVVKFLNLRLEDCKEKFDLVVTRSSVPYPWSVEMVSPVVKENGIFIPFLGRKTYDLNLEKEILAKTAFNETKEIDLIELEFLGKRHIKFLQKAKQKREFHPRPWAEIQKEIRTYNG